MGKVVKKRDKHLCLMVYKALNNKAPGYLRNLFTRSSEYSKRRSRLRNSELNLVLTRIPRTEFLKQSFSYRGVQAWNNLNNHYKISQSLNVFKSKLSVVE